MTIKMAQPKPQQFSKKLKQDIQQQLRQAMTTLRLLPLNGETLSRLLLCHIPNTEQLYGEKQHRKKFQKWIYG